MSTPDDSIAETLLADMPAALGDQLADGSAAHRPRDMARLMHKIPVTLTLEVGTARISLEELSALQSHSVLELDTLAGEPLTIKINGTPIGRAEVVIMGENYGLKVLELSDLDLGSLS